MSEKVNNCDNFIQIKISGGYQIIPINSIIYIKAQGKFTIVYLKDLSTIVSFHVLKWYSINLTKIIFFRCHKSYLINLKFVNYFNSKEIILINNIKIPISRNRLISFKENLISSIAN